ncbi:hypothetical protein LEP1GSC125_2601 [Leptospira mayottensis 200901122]|uniref:Uncharacterized protein n=1 Tax=Leptospira mayottensis 200901122 TaxID=1193010 RepID=A0AA87MPW4_9LEPT|nr:hypothetical protein LEP1GSC125_2601 [Leptospira mayottensis 200901122]
MEMLERKKHFMNYKIDFELFCLNSVLFFIRNRLRLKNVLE